MKKHERWQKVPESSLGFGKLLHPYNENTFLQNSLSQSYLYVSGDAQKFSNLFGWSALNYVLSTTALKFPQLRIVKGDAEEPPASFFRDPDKGSTLRLRELNQLLLDG